MIRNIKILLALAVALWGVLGGLANLAGYQDGLQTVHSVLSMETLPEGVLVDGPKTPNPFMVTLGFAFIWFLKLAGGALCLVGTGQMWFKRHAGSGDFVRAKRWAVAGCGVLIFMLFFGFSFIAVGPFKLYMSHLVSAVQLAALFAVQIGIVMVFLHQIED